jgi:hypothetical protein
MKVDRVTIITSNKDENGYTWDHQCDLCDKKKKDTIVPFLYWNCKNDGSKGFKGHLNERYCEVGTFVCMDCIAILNGED